MSSHFRIKAEEAAVLMVEGKSLKQEVEDLGVRKSKGIGRFCLHLTYITFPFCWPKHVVWLNPQSLVGEVYSVYRKGTRK